MSEGSDGQTSIEASELSKVYWDGGRRLEILKSVSLSVKKGEGVAILGPSGSGKSTLLNILSGLDRADTGTVRLEGVDLLSLNENQKAEFRSQNIGFIFQFYHLLPEFSALENVTLPLLMGSNFSSAAAARVKAEAVLERVGLKDRLKHFPGELSGGEQQRVAIARALVREPKVLFCDEPTGNLDPKMGEEIGAILQSVFERDKRTVLVVTHDERIAKMASRVWKIMNGAWDNDREKKCH